MADTARIRECNPPAVNFYERDGEMTITPLDDEPGHLHIMLIQHGDVLGIVLDEAGARKAAAALLAPFA